MPPFIAFHLFKTDDCCLIQSFTMEMMLKTLNIELELIGYDKKDQRWID
jgi:hypothetical protein